MRCRIEYTPIAERQIRGLPQRAQRSVLKAIEDRAEHPRPGGSKPLRRRDLHRVRFGRYRITYQREKDSLRILVVKATDRKHVYDRLPKRRRVSGVPQPSKGSPRKEAAEGSPAWTLPDWLL